MPNETERSPSDRIRDELASYLAEPDVSSEDTAAFAVHTADRTLAWSRSIGWMMLVAGAVSFPFALLFDDPDGLLGSFLGWRGAALAAAGLALVPLDRWSAARRAPTATFGTVHAIVAAFYGASAGFAGGFDSPFPYVVYLVPLVTLGLLVPAGPRLAVTSAITMAYAAGYLVADPARAGFPSDVTAAAVGPTAVFGGTAIAVSVICGDVMFVVRRRIFHQQRALQLRADELETLDRLKSEFIASMSHELRTPLNAILGYSQLLEEELEDALDGDLDEELVEELVFDLRQIHQAGTILLGRIDEILDFSKVQAGRMQVYPETFAAQDLLGEVIDEVRPLAKESGNHLQFWERGRAG